MKEQERKLLEYMGISPTGVRKVKTSMSQSGGKIIITKHNGKTKTYQMSINQIHEFGAMLNG